ncbi:hypothetical protein LVD17_21010 [Fulvivirga ulvae]|uniref:immunoglobulin domain-containing protein n=1 Tax=Fulvivirga ulvae TaxID=2904245 RepID=UPI001F361854|nr:hypothetical protein [Fulvivirga ulvae]UII30777.1 hypothetical protein LVD17_21010 [Fulvivirga ulvae]
MKFFKVLLFTVFFTQNIISEAQITGEQTVLQNQTREYSCLNCKSSDAPNVGSPIKRTYWADISGAQILGKDESNGTYISIKWNTIGTFYIKRMFETYSGITGSFRTLTVYVGDPYPDGNSIQGPHYVLLNSTESYTCPTCYDGWSPIQDGYWTAVGGTIQGANNNKNAVSVKWTSLGTKTLKWGTDECGGSYCAFNTKTVYVGQLPSAPSSPIKYNLSCNKADLYSTNTPPSGTTWYWQRSLGTDESNPYSPGVNWVITDRGSGAFYLRAKSNFGWGGHVSLSIYHSTWWHPADMPVAPDVDICERGTVVLTSSSRSDRWYSSSGTYLHTGDTYSPTINSNTTFFVEGVSEHGCFSTSKTQVDVTIKPVILKSLTGGGAVSA